jgi:protein MAK16
VGVARRLSVDLPGSVKLKTSKVKPFAVSNFCTNCIRDVTDFNIGNEHNVSGFCSKQSCPLANSRYATIRSDPATGNLYLYVKAIERSHLPSRWWEKIKLPRDYAKALEIVDSVRFMP